jgi:transglutaminase-like putative cysteine protease
VKLHKEFHSVPNKQFSPLQLAGFIGLSVVALCILFYFFCPDSESQYSTTSKTLRFNYTLRNTSGEFIPHADFAVKIPMSIDAIQHVESINSSHKNKLVEEGGGEQSVHFPIDNISPYASKIIDLTLVVNINDRPKYERINAADYLATEKYIELESPAIKALAAQLKGSSPEETARNIYEWLVNNVTPSSYTADSKGAQYLIEKKSGDCTELMYAFVALARANGLPARGVSGFFIPGESTIINAADYHDWAEFYDGKRWVMVDANKKIFDSLCENYISVGEISKSASMERFFLANKNINVSFQ